MLPELLGLQVSQVLPVQLELRVALDQLVRLELLEPQVSQVQPGLRVPRELLVQRASLDQLVRLVLQESQVLPV